MIKPKGRSIRNHRQREVVLQLSRDDLTVLLEALSPRPDDTNESPEATVALRRLRCYFDEVDDHFTRYCR